MARLIRGFGFGLAVALAVLFILSPSEAVAQGPGTGTWSGTIEISNQLSRSYKIRYYDEPESTNRVQGASNHTLSYRIDLSATRGTPDFELFPGDSPNAALAEFSWVGGASAPGFGPEDCDYAGSGSESAAGPMYFFQFYNDLVPSFGLFDGNGNLSLGPLGDCDTRPVFGVGDSGYFREPDGYDNLLVQGCRRPGTGHLSEEHLVRRRRPKTR